MQAVHHHTLGWLPRSAPAPHSAPLHTPHSTPNPTPLHTPAPPPTHPTPHPTPPCRVIPYRAHLPVISSRSVRCVPHIAFWHATRTGKAGSSPCPFKIYLNVLCRSGIKRQQGSDVDGHEEEHNDAATQTGCRRMRTLCNDMPTPMTCAPAPACMQHLKGRAHPDGYG